MPTNMRRLKLLPLANGAWQLSSRDADKANLSPSSLT